MLWCAIHLPRLPLQVFLRGAALAGPLAVVGVSSRPEVLACNAVAHRLGVAPGMSIAAALALAPEIEFRVRDESAEAAALAGLARWAGQFTPTVSLAPPQCVLLELADSLAYFGGLAPLVECIVAGVEALGWRVRLACAPTPLAATLFARAGLAEPVTGTAELGERLAGVPLALLESAQPVLGTLYGLGLTSVGDLARLPLEGLARRFGQGLIDELRRARGELPDARAVFVPPREFSARLELPAPTGEVEALAFAVKRLLAELAGFLRARGAGVTMLALTLVHKDVESTNLTFGLAATRNEAHILRVVRERLAREQLPDRVEALVLESREIVSLAARQEEFFPGAPPPGETRQQLLERLAARLGETAVRRIATRADHRPERAWRYLAAGQAGTAGPLPPGGARPLWLLPSPQPLPDGLAVLTLVSGPERLESGWWDGDDIARDYFVGRDASERCLWVFRTRAGEWFVHGVFG